MVCLLSKGSPGHHHIEVPGDPGHAMCGRQLMGPTVINGFRAAITCGRPWSPRCRANLTDRSASRPGLSVPLLLVRFAPGRGTSSASRGWPCLSRPSGGQLSAWPAVLEHDALDVFAVGLVGMGGSADHLLAFGPLGWRSASSFWHRLARGPTEQHCKL